MVYILSKIVDFLISVGVASIIAIWLGLAAHYLGLSRLDIRTSALMGAGIIALVLALSGPEGRENPNEPSRPHSLTQKRDYS
jgi:purine-cytosine permease-like protein